MMWQYLDVHPVLGTFQVFAALIAVLVTIESCCRSVCDAIKRGKEPK